MKVLRRIGIEQMVVETGIKPDCYISRAWDTGETMYKIEFDAASETRFGGPYRQHSPRRPASPCSKKASRRGSIAFNHRLLGLEETRDAIRLVFENGAKVDADIVSRRGRNQLQGAGISARHRAAALRRGGRRSGRSSDRGAARRCQIPDCTKWWGRDRHILAYFMTGKRDEVYVIGRRSQAEPGTAMRFVAAAARARS